MLDSLVLVQPKKTRSYITERLLMGCKESNQINKNKSGLDMPKKSCLFHWLPEIKLANYLLFHFTIKLFKHTLCHLQTKMQLKMSSAEIVSCMQMFMSRMNFGIQTISNDPDQTDPNPLPVQKKKSLKMPSAKNSHLHVNVYVKD